MRKARTAPAASGARIACLWPRRTWRLACSNSRCEIDGVEGGVVMPVRTHHHDMLEVVSRKHLRRTLKLKDGDKVRVKVYL